MGPTRCTHSRPLVGWQTRGGAPCRVWGGGAKIAELAGWREATPPGLTKVQDCPTQVIRTFFE
ncbi:hypothetical protein Hanom_Chr06g00540861 [Helianthus anomalus]